MLSVLTLIAWTLLGYILPKYTVIPTMSFILRENFSQSFWISLAQIIFYIVSVALTVFVAHKFIKKWRTNRTELGLKGLPTWTDIGLSCVGLVAYFILAYLLTQLFSLLPFFDASEAQETMYDSYLFGIDRLFAIIAIVFVAPVAEEIVFRGWLYGKLRAKIPGKLSLVISIFIVSLLFGILHGQFNVAVNVFAMSVIMCLMRETTGTIYSGILLHILKNAIAFYLVFVMV